MTDLFELQDNLVRGIVESELGRPLEEVFSRFDEKPLAAASIAVVHRATLLDGTAVAVKVLRPGIDQTVSTDLGLLEGMVRFAAARGIDQAYNMVALVVGLRAQIACGGHHSFGFDTQSVRG